MMMKEELANLVRTFEALGPIVINLVYGWHQLIEGIQRLERE
jgi:hypothetical protein